MQAAFINASNGQAFNEGDTLRGAMALAYNRFGLRADSVDKQRLDYLVQRLDSIVRDVRRGDSAFAGAGPGMARQLEHIYAEVLREAFPVPNGLALFPLDSSVPVGARTHTVRRLYQHGEATVYRSGATVPTVGYSQAEETFPVRHYVTSFVSTLFERQAAGFANIGELRELMRIARDIVTEFINRMTWYGSEDHGVRGVLNYPWLDKAVVATAFDGSATGEAVKAELDALANHAAENSNTRFSPTRCVTSPRVRNYLKNTRINSYDNTKILKDFTENNAYIDSVDEAWELQGVGPGGTDGILFYRDDRMGIVNSMVQGFTALPAQQQGFAETTFCYASHGGIIMRDVGNNVLGWVNAG